VSGIVFIGVWNRYWQMFLASSPVEIQLAVLKENRAKYLKFYK